VKEQWDELRTLFDTAWPLAAGERELLLAERCNGNPRLRRELEKLLHAHDHAVGPDAAAPIGRRFGAWQTVELLGRGGMAEVYLANRADGHYEQRGALKLMPRNLLSWDYLDRFRRERDILANLDHPNIARLLDGGVSDAGDPFLVMEFVDGRRIDEYCDAHGLNVRARLALFLTLCSAVESAHRSLVLHRDIKPSNVLVTADGAVKLLDFGTARRIDGSGLETMAPLTPAFASPEQLRGEAVTTLSDVYGLGMTLYRLLAGTLPFGPPAKSAYHTIQETLERTPPTPSEAPGVSRERSHELRGDLDNIVLKAIHRDPAQRYTSAARLADDVVHFLERRPVEARPSTWRYRAGRFAARNRVGVGLSAVLLITVCAAAVALALQMRQARLEAVRSQRLAEFLTHTMGLGYDTGSGPLRTEGVGARAIDVLRYAGDNLERGLAGQPQLEARLRADLGHALAEVGYTDEAGRLLRRGLALVDARREPLLAAELHGYLARNQYIEGDVIASGAEFAESLRLLQAAPRPVPGQVESLLLLNAAAREDTLHGATPEVLRMIERSLARAREVGEDSPMYALALANHGGMIWENHHAEEGEREIRRALEIQNRMTPRPLETCVVMLVLAGDVMHRGRLEEAGRLLDEARPCIERSFRAGSLIPAFAQLAALELEFRRGNARQVIEPLRKLQPELARGLPKAVWIQGELLVLRGTAECRVSQKAEGQSDLKDARDRLALAFGADSEAAQQAAELAKTCAAESSKK
jgi:serine/threonine-protein kinase